MSIIVSELVFPKLIFPKEFLYKIKYFYATFLIRDIFEIFGGSRNITKLAIDVKVRNLFRHNFR